MSSSSSSTAPASVKDYFQDLEIQLESELIITKKSPSMTFDNNSRELLHHPSLDDITDAHLDDICEPLDPIEPKIFDNLDLTRELAGIPGFSAGIPDLSSNGSHVFYESSAPSCSSTNGRDSKQSDEKDENTATTSDHEEDESYTKFTGFTITPPMANPVDMTAFKDMIAVADYDNGVHFFEQKGYHRKHFKVPPYRICGVKFYHDPAENATHVALLAYHEQQWTVNMYSWPGLKQECIFNCPPEPNVPSWARRKIVIIDDLLYLMGTAESCSAIWTLDLNTTQWKTLIVEKGRPAPASGISLTFANNLLNGGAQKASVYSDFDVHKFSKTESRIILCEAQKSRLDVLILGEKNEIIDTQTVKVKRRKNQKWIVQGPKLAVWDTEQDIIVYDGSGKIFWFDGSNYRIQKIVGDIGRSEVCSMEAKNGWCYVLCRHQLKIHAFYYR
ncbi:unnamed protein product [Bursaphelenchus xylophilus]|uniref:(pine wood nematode) hypothetical protein n=1 Tax=Bursaphelenchus xylophilus TaxID=6326 RepID=A0A1I7S059_BURXY|nr:unnamed protein product [Bursaphelenchus xylophilus]CAG9108996.1 unnamed protein product [Bursaphelenchus xylophilus]